jgi:hypothetical protein
MMFFIVVAIILFSVSATRSTSLLSRVSRLMTFLTGDLPGYSESSISSGDL